MSEKRKHARKITPHKVNVINADTDCVIGRLVDVTSTGMMMMSDAELELKAVVRLRVSVPAIITGKDFIECRGVVRWCRPDPNPRFHRVGIEFLDIDSEDASILEDVMHKLNLVG